MIIRTKEISKNKEKKRKPNKKHNNHNHTKKKQKQKQNQKKRKKKKKKQKKQKQKRKQKQNKKKKKDRVQARRQYRAFETRAAREGTENMAQKDKGLKRKLFEQDTCRHTCSCKFMLHRTRQMH